MMKKSLGRGLRMSSVVVLLSCGGAEHAEDVGKVEQSLTGTVTTVGCTAEETAYYERLFRYGNTLARSTAALECLIEFGVNGIGSAGPYEYCAGVGDGDPLPGEAQVTQAARIASSVVSHLNTQVRCNASCPGGRACSNDISAGQDEYIKWTSRNGPPPTDDPGDDDNEDMAADVALAWHEVSHAQGYEHDSDSQTCPTTKPSAQAPASIGWCIRKVGDQAAASPVCAAMACAPGERALPKRFYANGPTDPCECVPAVFRNENEDDDRFGASLATGDFDGDGYEDLAVGAPREDDFRGVVYVFRGSAYGPRFWKRLQQEDLTVISYAPSVRSLNPSGAAGDTFGQSLGAGDFNGDGYADLLVSAPGKLNDSGVVFIIPGSALGPDGAHGQWLDAHDSAIDAFTDIHFGAAIAVGNFDADAYQDFAIGVPYWDTSAVSNAGGVAIHRGRSVTPGAGRMQVSDGLLTEGVGGNVLGADDHFGWAIAAGNIDSDARDELVVGAPDRNSGNGVVFVLGKNGVTWENTQSITKTATRFGEVVAAGDFIGDGVGDVAVGAPHDASERGTVFTYQGTACCLKYVQTLAGASDDDYFGAGLTIGNVFGSAKGELIVGSPNRLSAGFGRVGGTLYYKGVSSTTTLAEPVLGSNPLPNGGENDVVFPIDIPAGWLGDPVALLRLPGTAAKAVVAGAITQYADGVRSGAVYIFRGNAAAWKLDQVTMRHGGAFPY